MTKQVWHPSEEQLFWALDGELPARELASVRGHLEACWSCRVRVERMQAAISDFVDYRDTVFGRVAASPPNKWQGFDRRLDAFLAQAPRLSLLDRFLVQLHRVAPSPRVVIVCTLMVALCVGLYRMSRAPAVSAAELLRRASQSEAKPAGSVVRQKVRVRVDGKLFDRQITRQGSAVSSTASADGAKQQAELQVAQVFQRNALDWNSPLSAQSFERWRQSLPDKEDTVEQQPDAFTLQTRRQGNAPDGAIIEATLRVRATDYHPVEQKMRVRAEPRDQEIELTEVSYEVLTAEDLTAEPLTPPQPAVLPPTLPAVPPLPTPGDLANAEWKARLALGRSAADLGEQIDLRVLPGSVEVTGVVSTAERKQDLFLALQRIPYVRVKLATVEEVAREQNASSPLQEIIPTAAASVPPLAMLLERRFPQPEDREAFTRQVLARSQDALQRAWALRRLAERYSDEQVALLSPASRAELEGLVRQHAAALSQQVQEVDQLMRPFWGPAEQAASGEPAGWRDSIERTFVAVEQWDRLHTQLFTGSEREAGDLLNELADIQESLKAHLESFQQFTASPFLRRAKEKP